MATSSIPETPRSDFRAVLLFDGVCPLCHAVVRFIVGRDPLGRFGLVPLQSELGRRLLFEHGLPQDTLDTVVLLQDGHAYLRSDAVLRVVRGLRAPWPAASLARVVPRPLRDALYRAIAQRRDRWFGRRDGCPVWTPEQRSRFLA